MARQDFNDLIALMAVAREGSFTKAAGQLGLSQSALSHQIRAFEARLGVRLLTRTTRSVSPTEAGERLIQAAGPRIEDIEAELAAVAELRDKPSGLIRITATDHAADAILWPRLAPVLRDYPDLGLEIVIDYGLTDIVTQRVDAGVRLGDQVAKDMIAVRIAPDMRMAVVAAPAYLERHPAPRTPQALTEHACINLRLPTLGGLYAWEFAKGRRQVKVRVDGQLAFNGLRQILNATLAGFGLAYLPADFVAADVASGRLRQVLEDWCPTFPGYHLYYPSRRQSSRAMALVVEALRHRG
jgi:DNA-binding transcriptional LysR family regulator